MPRCAVYVDDVEFAVVNGGRIGCDADAVQSRADRERLLLCEPHERKCAERKREEGGARIAAQTRAQASQFAFRDRENVPHFSTCRGDPM